ncbi:MAG: hypothetical protein U9P68_08710 [Pseudomonadota bacterium]|nr:hypothetical protein [Pseudomonadota bacterium]
MSESESETAETTTPADREEAVEEARAELEQAPESELPPDVEEFRPKEIKKFQHSARRDRALLLLEHRSIFEPMAYKENASHLIKPEPGAYEKSEYAGQIDCYTGFKHELIHFHKETVLNFRRWVNHSDINIYVIENKFPIDAAVRDYITAFKLILKSYQWLHILWKRVAQIVAIVVFCLLALNLPAITGLFAAFPASTGAYLGIAGALALVIGLVMYGAIKSLTDNFQARLQSASTTLGATLNSKTARLNTRFAQVCNDAGNARSTYDSNQRDWIEHAKWLTRVAMWLPKRVDYMDRFFQLEMQNIRAFRNGSSIIGNLSALTILLIAEALLGWRLHTVLQSGGGPELESQALLVVAGMLFAAVVSWLSTTGAVSLRNSDIMRWMNEQSWTKFGDFDMFRNIEGIVDTYAYQVYADQNRGSSRA